MNKIHVFIMILLYVDLKLLAFISWPDDVNYAYKGSKKNVIPHLWNFLQFARHVIIHEFFKDIN